jgi:hypothetical protein
MAEIRSGYSSSPADWMKFLGCWRQQVNQRLRKDRGWSGLDELPSEVNIVYDSTESPEAMAEIRQIEARLNVRLPVSYVHFMTTTRGRGWVVEAFADAKSDGRIVGGINPVGSIGYFGEIDPVNHDVWVA